MFDCNDLAYAFGKPEASGTIKTLPEDFRVDEHLGFELSGEGEHLFLRIEKRGLNTEEVAKALSRSLGKSLRDISHAGLKDRQALTTQWFSVQCPGEDRPEAASLEGPGWRVLDVGRNLKKLKTGALKANHFTLIVRDLSARESIEQRLQQIQSTGVPNYFGPQRFGINGQNLVKADALLSGAIKVKDRFLRGIYYSAARSFLFNKILSKRVEEGSWNSALSGDVMQLAGTHSIFAIEAVEAIIQQRIKAADLSPVAPLWGRGSSRVTLDALALQESILKDYRPWCEALESQGLEQSQRALILHTDNLNWRWEAENLVLSFSLDPGCYATSVMRELFLG